MAVYPWPFARRRCTSSPAASAKSASSPESPLPTAGIALVALQIAMDRRLYLQQGEFAMNDRQITESAPLPCARAFRRYWNARQVDKGR